MIEKSNILERYVKQVNQLVDNHDNSEFRINSIEFNPRFDDRIFFNVDLYNMEEKDNQINNLFFIFFVQYFFKKMDNFLNGFNKTEHLTERMKKVEEELKDIELEITGKENIDTFFIINFKKTLSDETQKICSNMLIKIRKQIEQMYFYIFQLFVNWLFENELKISEKYDWDLFFKMDEGW